MDFLFSDPDLAVKSVVMKVAISLLRVRALVMNVAFSMLA